MKNKLLIFFCFLSVISFSQNTNNIPYSTDNNYLTVWNGSEYIPIFLKGTNLGVSVPGTFPGELAATRMQYANWFQQIKDAGFNCIRLYTLHFPKFYEVLDSFNLANPQNPLLFIQGVWLNEELPGYDFDLEFMTDTFKHEIEENIDCVHGNRIILPRQGKAYGNYLSDVSNWCLAYIIGREVYPEEVLTTDQNHLYSSSFQGNHFSISSATASEVWFVKKIEHLVAYENLNYNTQRPVSVSSWPTLDPLSHHEEQNRYEDTASLDLSKVVLLNAPAGFFISYHAYPYYPDFVSLQSNYLTFTDNYGLNSYLGYLTDLKQHYSNYPLIIAEFGVPSSWGIAHYATSSMNHGGFDEVEQGDVNIRLLQSIKNTNCGGGIHFAWIDEWFKRTWITDPVDYISNSRILWHNITAAEQNYGLVSFSKDDNLQTIQQFDSTSLVTNIKADANYTFFEIEIGLKNPLNIPDEMWIAFDTYADDLGESILPNGVNIPFRSEFALHITNYSANLYVTEAYDIFGIWHNISGVQQQYQSVASDGAPWYIVRWKNNSGHSDVQYIGNLKVNYGFQNPSSKDGVTIFDDKIKICIPWSLINVVAPDQFRVLHDNKSTPEREDTITNGFNIGAYYQQMWYPTSQRFTWLGWNIVEPFSLNENFKKSYYVMQDRLIHFNTPAFAVRDSYVFDNELFPIEVPVYNGLLKNDFDLDGNFMIALITKPPVNGFVDLNNDGSFLYAPYTNFNGLDSMQYCVFDGYSLSEPNYVIFEVIGNNLIIDDLTLDKSSLLDVYPNPTTSLITLKSSVLFDELFVFGADGKIIKSFEWGKKDFQFDLSAYSNGVYFIVGKFENRYYSKKLIKAG